ncbi:zinc ribbon domain-containing protein [Streptosporangium sp. NPDC005286]|uniref:zinc ribbon domain-containing protein n=1 Tax=Streptosporangium sp. NPDC005286 TaxID=3154463 RepID=UPI0033B49DF0
MAGQAWGRTVTLLEYKTSERGGQVVKVPARGTSQTCHRCGQHAPAARGGTRYACRTRITCPADFPLVMDTVIVLGETFTPWPAYVEAKPDGAGRVMPWA